MKYKIESIKMKKYIIASILLLLMAVVIACFAINANAENSEVTAGIIEDEKSMIKLASLISRANSANNKVEAGTLLEQLNKYAGNGKATVTEKDADTVVITFVATGNEYEINVNTGPAFEDAGSGGVVNPGGAGDSTTLASVTNANIGDYIDLGNNIVGTASTADDWRILYVEGNTVYAILADYLPNSTNYAANAGLKVSGEYIVCLGEHANNDNINRDKLLTELTTEQNWNSLANGISEATVTGSPTAELLMSSYNTKNGTSLEYMDCPTLDSSTTDYDLYVPRTEGIDECYSYWLATLCVDDSSNLWSVYCDGIVEPVEVYYGSSSCGIRPVVSLSSETECSYAEGVWTIGGEAEPEPTPPESTGTLASVTNDNIGNYIDLGNNIIGTTSTADDWRILYVEGSTVYAILADYLPNSTNYAANAGLNTLETYNVYSSANSDTFLTGLTTTSNWNGLANGIAGATVTGSPTVELLMKSYNAKNGTSLDYTAGIALDDETIDYDLYVPHTSNYKSCFGYWLASPYGGGAYEVWCVNCYGDVFGGDCDYCYRGIRPVVVLPSSTGCSYSGGVWTIGGDGESGGTPGTTLPSTEYTTPYLPSDEFFQVAGTDLSTGLVIEDDDQNQYVWIEVPRTADVYDNLNYDLDALTGTELENAYTEIETDLKEYTDTYKSGYSDVYGEYYGNPTTGLTRTTYTELKQKMLKSVYENGGFYIGRYEAGTDTFRAEYSEISSTLVPTSKENQYPLTYIKLREAQTLASRVESGEYTSSVMFGVQWDLVLKYLETKGVTEEELKGEDEGSTNWGNYKYSTFTLNRGKYRYSTWYEYTTDLSGYVESSVKIAGENVLYTTGASDQNRKQNIYDLAGNVEEWILVYTSIQAFSCARRGGDFAQLGSWNPASSCDYIGYDGQGMSLGFRVAIY